MLGVINSNYSGVYGIGLNPASMINSKLYLDFNLLGGGLSFDNSFFYLLREDYFDLLFRRESPVYFTTEGEERNVGYYYDKVNKWGFGSLKILGPSAMLGYGKHAFGFTTSLRSYQSFNNLPPDMAAFFYEAIDYDKQHGIVYDHNDNIELASLSWIELGFSYAYNFHRYKWESWTLGITVKPLLGSAGMYANIYDVIYEVHNDDSASVYNANFEYGFALPINYETNEFPQKPLFNGFGFGVDVGVTYLKTHRGHSNMVINRLCEQEFDDYNYKVGFSILDIGYIKFNKNAVYRGYSETYTEWYEPDDVLPDSTLNLINDKVDYYFEDNAANIEKADNFTMNLPPALSFQFEYAPKKYLFLNTTLIYGFVLGRTYVKRPSILAFAPRYETGRMEAAIPISFYEWNWGKPRIGFSFRYGNFFFGFDKLNTIFGFGDFTGVDIYAGIRLNLSNTLRMNYIKGNCGNRNLRDIETFDFRNF
jgi:hypothetical protein